VSVGKGNARSEGIRNSSKKGGDIAQGHVGARKLASGISNKRTLA